MRSRIKRLNEDYEVWKIEKELYPDEARKVDFVRAMMKKYGRSAANIYMRMRTVDVLLPMRAEG